MVDKLEGDVKRSPYVVRDEKLNNYVSDLVCRLAQEYCPHIRVYIVNNPQFNASMYPNGMMHVHTGLLLRVENESQLAAVIGHELAHYLLTHQILQYKNLKSTSGITTILDIALMSVTGVYGLGSLGLYSKAASYGRQGESDADQYGLDIIRNHGYDMDEAVELWSYLEVEREADQSKSNRNPFFATHPATSDRITTLKEFIKTVDSAETSAPAGGLNEVQYKNPDDMYLEVISSSYALLMREQIALQEHEQTNLLLEKHLRMGLPVALIEFYRGEMLRQRNLAGDRELAISAYRNSLSSAGAPVGANRELAYLLLKEKRSSEALAEFKNYLGKSPDADDRQMIEYYINDLESKE